MYPTDLDDPRLARISYTTLVQRAAAQLATIAT
jgi:hypothetical protein